MSSGIDSLLVVVNHGLTKGVILCPTKKTITIEGIATLFFHKVYLHFGLYDKVISDWGSQFISSFAWELGKLLKYNLSLFSAYHPQSDGETEWVNQEVRTYYTFGSSAEITLDLGLTSSSTLNLPTITDLTPLPITNQSQFYLTMGYKPCALPSIISDMSILLKNRVKADTDWEQY